MQTGAKAKLVNSKNSAYERIIVLKSGEKLSVNQENMGNIRIIKKNLVYVIGISKEMANKNVSI